MLAAGGGVGLAAFLSAPAPSVAAARAAGASGSGKGTVRALFMKQAGYSETDIRAMTSAFQTANPDITVTADFVAYEALHDKIVAAAPAGTYDVVLIDVIWPAEFGSKHIVADVTSKWPEPGSSRCSAAPSRRRSSTPSFYGVPWILDTKYLFFNAAHLAKAKVDAAPARDLGRRPQGGPGHQGRRASPSTRWCGPGSRPRR